MGSEESHFNVSVGILSDGQSHKTVPTNHSLSEEKGEQKRYRTEVLPLTSLRLTARPNRLSAKERRWRDVYTFIKTNVVKGLHHSALRVGLKREHNNIFVRTISKCSSCHRPEVGESGAGSGWRDDGSFGSRRLSRCTGNLCLSSSIYHVPQSRPLGLKGIRMLVYNLLGASKCDNR